MTSKLGQNQMVLFDFWTKSIINKWSNYFNYVIIYVSLVKPTFNCLTIQLSE